MELQLSPKELPVVSGNFETYKEELTKLVESYKDKPLTEETVAPVKSALRQMRTTLEKVESTSIAAYFDTPKKLLKAQFAELYSIIAEGENKVDAVIAEDTRRRNEETAARLTNYIISKSASMKLDTDVVDHVILKKHYFNKTAKEGDTLNEIDSDLLDFEKNYASYQRAERKINKLAYEIGGTFNRERFIYALSKYGNSNDSTAALAEEEAERLKNIPKEEKLPPATAGKESWTPPSVGKVVSAMEEIIIEFPPYDKKTSKGSDEIVYTFSVPKEAKKQFAELLKQLKTVGIKATKV
jgi:hypothetical protein